MGSQMKSLTEYILEYLPISKLDKPNYALNNEIEYAIVNKNAYNLNKYLQKTYNLSDFDDKYDITRSYYAIGDDPTIATFYINNTAYAINPHGRNHLYKNIKPIAEWIRYMKNNKKTIYIIPGDLSDDIIDIFNDYKQLTNDGR